MNYLQVIKFGSYKLRQNNIESHILDSELLLSFVLKSSREQILTKLNSNIKKNNFEEFKKFYQGEKRRNQLHILLIRKNSGKTIFMLTIMS